MPKAVRDADKFWTSTDRIDAIARVIFIVVVPMVLIGVGILLSVVVESVMPLLTLLLLAILFATVLTIPSRVVRAHLFGRRSRDSLEYTFHCSLCKPPFRKRTASLPTAAASGEFEVPACFLPRVIDRSPSSFLSFASSASLSKIHTETEVAASGPRPVEC